MMKKEGDVGLYPIRSKSRRYLRWVGVSGAIVLSSGYLTYLAYSRGNGSASEEKRPWRILLRRAERSTGSYLKAVRDLSRLERLFPGEWVQIAQALSYETAVGLARYPESDLRFFANPPPLPPVAELSSLQNLFKDILSALPENGDSIHPCVRRFTKNALTTYVPNSDDDHLRDSDLSHEFHRESHHIYAIPRKRYSEGMLVEYCLQALLSHSTVESHCRILLKETYLLPVLLRLCKVYPYDPRIKSIIGKILANISLYPEFHGTLFQSGWVGILAKWKRDPNLLITLPATKALCNMDQKYTGHSYQPGIYPMLPKDRYIESQSSNVDVVLIHGLLGGVFFSWRQGDPLNQRGWGRTDLQSTSKYSYCWPRDWIDKDTDSKVRVIGVDFDTYLSQWGGPCPSESFSSTLEERGVDILEKLKKCGVGRKGKRIVFVGHSMGGLVIKKILTAASESPLEEDRNLAQNTRGVVFYGTPHRGSEVAKLNATSKFLFFPSTEVKELEPNSQMLVTLNSKFVEWVKEKQKGRSSIKIVSFGETDSTPYLGFDLTFVPERSSDPGIGDHYLVKTNHMNICKPDSTKSILYRKLISLIWEVQDELTCFEH